jgi:hypothetical protein
LLYLFDTLGDRNHIQGMGKLDDLLGDRPLLPAVGDVVDE